jgi:maltodextrin utilization protein YvdJ
LSEMAFSKSFLPLLLAPFIMLYPWVRMDYYDKCWQYQNIDYRYFDYIYLYIYMISNILSPLIKHWVWGDRFPLLSMPPAVTNLFSRAFQQLKSIGSGECNPLENV